MYAFIIMEYVILFKTIFIPAKLISNEVEKNTFDLVLSNPISRWRYILEKYSTFLVYNLLYPAFTLISAVVSANVLSETLDYAVIAYASLGVWMRFFGLGSMSLLCGAIFLENRKAVGVAAALIFGQYMFNIIGGVTESVEWLRKISLFYYFDPGVLLHIDKFPVGEFFGVLGVGLAALIGALVIFQKRELAI